MSFESVVHILVDTDISRGYSSSPNSKKLGLGTIGSRRILIESLMNFGGKSENAPRRLSKKEASDSKVANTRVIESIDRIALI